MKKYIEMDQLLYRLDDSIISEEQFSRFIDEFIDLTEKHGLVTGGGMSLQTEEEMDKKYNVGAE
jgi:hypothetical protein